MLAQKNDYIKEASNTIYQLTQEEKIRQQCEAREDYYRAQRDLTRLVEAQKAIIAEQKSAIAEKDSTIAALKAELERFRNMNSAQNP